MATERVLPAVALPIPARPAPVAHRPALVAQSRPSPTAHAAKRAQPLLTTPARASMLIGASAAVYAVSLAAVSGLQAGSDAELIARRQPWLDQVAQARAANDKLEAALLQAGDRAEALGESYGRTGAAVAAYEARLDTLAALVADVQGTVAALPSRINLPKVTVRGAVRSTRPATSSTSGASGG